ncbi:MAG: hypothetical protein H0X65_08430 [Gemmatimonadetes bacterium]|nr:hypothetical protein [Gemmatimonadota bacterium]
MQSVLAGSSAPIDQVASRFHGARRDHVARHLETLQIMDEAQQGPDGAYQIVRQAIVPV